MDLLDKVQMEDLDEEQRTLAGLIGIEAFRALVRNYNGTPHLYPQDREPGETGEGRTYTGGV